MSEATTTGDDMLSSSDYDGQERRAGPISSREIERIATIAAKRAIGDLFEVFGVDTTTQEGRKGIQDDFRWVRDARVGSSAMKTAGFGAVLATLVTAALYALWKGMTVIATVMGKMS